MTGRIRTALRILLISGLIFALGIAPAFASSIPAWINSSQAQVYISADKHGTVRAGLPVEVTATRSGWAQIRYKDRVGYVQLKYLTAMSGIPGYVRTPAYVYQYASTKAAKYGPLGVGTELKVVGLDGEFLQVTNGRAYGYIAASAMSRTKPSDKAILASKVELIDWSKANYLFGKGSYAEIYDIQSGITVRVRRLGGSKHAEMEPVTAEDTKKLLKMDGGAFSWNSRPVILHAGGKYMVAAINTMPHGEQSIYDNGFDGQFCLHLPGSKTHGSDTVNANHQLAIKYAYAWALATR